mmetsp:Transcript_23372/g.54620  ORF Transcript_23372/g.54620 Transcript_23372/m.54620 type:complete len:263 (+) Transcript_23372:210-998(+)
MDKSILSESPSLVVIGAPQRISSSGTWGNQCWARGHSIQGYLHHRNGERPGRTHQDNPLRSEVSGRLETELATPGRTTLTTRTHSRGNPPSRHGCRCGRLLVKWQGLYSEPGVCSVVAGSVWPGMRSGMSGDGAVPTMSGGCCEDSTGSDSSALSATFVLAPGSTGPNESFCAASACSRAYSSSSADSFLPEKPWPPRKLDKGAKRSAGTKRMIWYQTSSKAPKAMEMSHWSQVRDVVWKASPPKKIRIICSTVVTPTTMRK